MPSAELASVRLWLLQNTGLQADRLGRQRLERVLALRRRDRACSATDSYQELLLGDPQEQQRLLEELVVGESWFLREPRSFEQLVALARRQRQRPLRVLSCGCAGGEEPYSVVISLVEAGLSPAQLQVEAIDISANALQRAAAGLYSAHALRGIQPQRLARFFQAEGKRWRLRPEIRGAVRFHQGALQRRLAGLPGGWHAVLCRNVMLYFNDEARRQLLMAIAERLDPEGLLLVAAAEAPMVPTSCYARLEGGHGAGFRLAAAGSNGPASGGEGAAITATGASGRPDERRPKPQRPAPQHHDPQPQRQPRLEPAVHLAAAHQLRRRDQPEDAVEALRRCLYLDPNHDEALALLAALTRELGRHQEAERQTRRLERRRRRRTP